MYHLFVYYREEFLEHYHRRSAVESGFIAVNPGVVKRHKRFMKCLRSTGVTVELARFKEKDVRFRTSNDLGDLVEGVLKRNEEKETDVAIAAKLFELLVGNQCNTAILVTGDTDLAPACKIARSLFPNKDIGFAFPYWRKNKELAKLASLSFNIDRMHYTTHQFPDPVTLAGGEVVSKPIEW